MLKLITILLIIFLPLKNSLSKEYNNNQNALEITVPIYYDPLSKIKNSSIIGSSSIVLTQDILEKYDYLPLHSIIEKETGIKVRSLYGYNTSGSKSTVDIRGMGAQAKSNVLILVNGQRLNNIDMGEIDYTSIPKSSINKIDIFKGNAASVF